MSKNLPKRKTVAIVGVGLIGGSLGMALRRAGGYRVIGIGRRASALKNAQRLGAIDRWSLDFAAAKDADIVVIATPVSLIVPTFKALRAFLKPQAVVTDVGSVKGDVLRKLAAARALNFIGAHPVAGSHKTGVSFARRDLFKGAVCVIVPGKSQGQKLVVSMWRAAGASPVLMKADQHDQLLALISHLPHVIAHAMVHAVLGNKNEKILKRLMAGSFRDVTRVASADAHQWASILNSNPLFVKKSIQSFIRELRQIDQKIGKTSLISYLQKSQKFRAPLFQS